MNAGGLVPHPGGLLHDQAPVLGAGVQHGVELALAHDDVLLATHTGVGQELLDVEEPARDAVDGVLAVTGAEQRPAQGDLRRLDRQEARAVVDREGDLGPSQRRALGRTGEDDVVHAGRADGPRALGTEDPRHGVHHVGLAAAVGADDNGDPGLELERRRLGEGLEALERERL